MKVSNWSQFVRSAGRQKQIYRALIRDVATAERSEIVNHAKSNHDGTQPDRYQNQSSNLTLSIGIQAEREPIQVTNDAVIINIEVGMDYAEHVESKLPFMRPAVEARAPHIVKNMERAINEGTMKRV